MPIRGLTDTAKAAFPRLGKLHKGGAKVKNAGGKEVMGPDLPYFRFVSERPEVQTAFEEAYGNAPALLTVYLPYPSVEENFDCWREKWAGGGLVHRCDGQTMSIWLGQDGKYRREPKPCDGGCKEVGRLSLWLPELLRAGFVGFVTFETHSVNDLLSIQGSLLAAIAHHIGRHDGLKGIQWTLRRAKEKISTPSQNGKRARRDKWMVKLEPAADWAQLQIQAAHNATMMLPAPRTVDEETGEINATMAVTPVEVEDIEPIEDYNDGKLTEVEDMPTGAPVRTEAQLRESVASLARQLGFKPEMWATKYAAEYHEPFETSTYDNLIACEKRLADRLAAKGAA